MARAQSRYVCQSCGASVVRWEGQCRTCGEWNTLVETVVRDEPRRPSAVAPAGVGAAPVPLSHPEADAGRPADRSASASWTACSAAGWSSGRSSCSAASPGSASPRSCSSWPRVWPARRAGVGRIRGPVRDRRGVHGPGPPPRGAARPDERRRGRRDPGRRRDGGRPDRGAGAGPNVPACCSWTRSRPSPPTSSTGRPGSVGQVRESTLRLMELAKTEGIPVVLVGHVTKDGTLAGPKTLEHLVDVVLSVEGDRTGGLRLLRASKNRYGSTEEVGVFEMGERGLDEVADPARAFLAEHESPAPGSVVAPVLEGSRPLLVEVQALVAPTGAPSPRRTASGVDPNRLALLSPCSDAGPGIGLSGHDVYANLAGRPDRHGARAGPAARAGARLVAAGPAGGAGDRRDRRGRAAGRAPVGGRARPAAARGGTSRVHARDRADPPAGARRRRCRASRSSMAGSLGDAVRVALGDAAGTRRRDA